MYVQWDGNAVWLSAGGTTRTTCVFPRRLEVLQHVCSVVSPSEPSLYLQKWDRIGVRVDLVQQATLGIVSFALNGQWTARGWTEVPKETTWFPFVQVGAGQAVSLLSRTVVRYVQQEEEDERDEEDDEQEWDEQFRRGSVFDDQTPDTDGRHTLPQARVQERHAGLGADSQAREDAVVGFLLSYEDSRSLGEQAFLQRTARSRGEPAYLGSTAPHSKRRAATTKHGRNGKRRSSDGTRLGRQELPTLKKRRMKVGGVEIPQDEETIPKGATAYYDCQWSDGSVQEMSVKELVRAFPPQPGQTGIKELIIVFDVDNSLPQEYERIIDEKQRGKSKTIRYKVRYRGYPELFDEWITFQEKQVTGERRDRLKKAWDKKKKKTRR